MREFIGMVLLAAIGITLLANGSILLGLLVAALAISAFISRISPDSPTGMPGSMVAVVLGTIVVFALVAVALGSFFDDC